MAYGIPGIKCDGTDVIAVYDAMTEAIERARAGGGPTIVEAVTMRMHGHAEHDPADYVLPELKDEWGERDPVALFENRLIEADVLTAEAAGRVREDAKQWAIEARKIALAAPMPDPADIEEGIYAD